MEKVTYDKELTALLVIDPYNDFISEGGKVWDRLRTVAEANGRVPHMLRILNAARKAELRVFYALHHRYRSGDYETWKYLARIQQAAWGHKTFEYGTWGGEIRPEFSPQPGDIVALEHWCSSGFANTDLDLQLETHGDHLLIAVGFGTYVRGGHRTLYRRARVPGYGGERRDRELRAGPYARRS